MEYFDNKQAGLMADMVMSMLKAMAQKFGIEVSLDRSQHTRSKLTLQVSFVVMGADGIPSDFGYKADRVGAPRDLYGLVDRISGPSHAVGAGLMGWGGGGETRPQITRSVPSFGGRFVKWLRALLPG